MTHVTLVDSKSPPFDRFRGIQLLAADRGGHEESAHARHSLYVARDRESRARVLIKVTSKPGLVYERDLANEIETLTTINRELPDSRHFPFVHQHGRLSDGRTYLVMSLFDEFPLATTVSAERIPARLVGHLRTTIEVARALGSVHRLGIVHADLNPMNILYRTEKGNPLIRVVDFESSYEAARHSSGVFYNPPTTPGYTAPEVSHQAPDARSDVFSLGAVLYTLLAGYEWTWGTAAAPSVAADSEIDPEIKSMLLTAVDPDPDRRYPSMQEFHDAVGSYLERIWPGRAW